MKQPEFLRNKKIYSVLLLGFIGCMLFAEADAQRGRGRDGNGEGGIGRPERQQTESPRQQSPGMNGQFQSPRQQEPRMSSQSLPGRDYNRPERSPRPRDIQLQPRVNNIPRNLEAPGNPRGNGNGGYSPRPRQIQQPHVNNSPERAPGQNSVATKGGRLRGDYDRDGGRNHGNYNNNNRGGYDRRPVRYERRPSYYFPRHQSYSAYNPGWRYSHLPSRNTVISSFSFPFITLNFGGYGYRYCDGVYYRPYNNVYRVVAPPIGIFINVLPFGYRRLYVNDNPYYYYNGTYYDEYKDSYRVIAPPVGAIVESIPEGYETIVIDGETYYKVDDIQYKPVVQENGEIWYEVIKIGNV